MKGKKVLVTGGAGFIGSHIAERLVEKNEVVVVDDLSTGKINNIKNLLSNKNLKFFNRSILNLNFLLKITEGVDYIFHQAAIPSVTRSIENPVKSTKVNVEGTLNVLMCAMKNDVKKVVYASSSSVYGETPKLPKIETMNPKPISPYSLSKLVGEYYCNIFREIYGVDTVSLRYFNVYGPRQNPSSKYSAVIPKFIFNAPLNKPLCIYGDGKQTRDFTFVGDVVGANLLALRGSGTYNIACGKRVSVNDLARKVIELTNSDSKIIHSEPRKGDIRHSLADIGKARKDMDYSPKYSLEMGLKESIKGVGKK